MQIRPIRRSKSKGQGAARPAKPLRERVRQWSQTPTGCRGCDEVRGLVARLAGAKPGKGREA